MFPSSQGNTIKEGEIPYVERTNTKPHQLIKRTKISYSIVSLVFRKFSYRNYQNGFRQTTTAQLKIITSSRSIVQASRTTWMFPSPRGNTISKGKIPYVERTNIKPHQLIKHNKISYSMVSLVFHKFSYQTCQNDLNQGNQSWGAPSTSKNTSPVSSIAFVRNPDFSILLHRVRYLKNLFISRR